MAGVVRAFVVLVALSVLMPAGVGADSTGPTSAPTGPLETSRVYLPAILSAGAPACVPLYSDDFDDPSSGWPIVDDDGQTLGYTGNEYRIISKEYNIQPIALSPFVGTEYAVAATVRPMTDGASSFGLVFGYSTSRSQGYTFEIYADGSYEIWRRDSSNVWETLWYDFSDDIKMGLVANRLKVVRQGNSISLYVNGNLIKTVSDNTYTGAGQLGFIVSSYDDDPFEVRFDDFTVYPLPCGATATSLP
jgi:hypothetical protein